MPDPRDLLICLLDYIKEQAKQINPAAYRLASGKGFQRQRGDIAGLPGVEFDIKVAGDHVWLKVPRLVAEPPPPPQPASKALIRFSSDPNGLPPSIDEPALARQINQRVDAARVRDEPIDVAQVETRAKAAAAEALSAYSALWTRWATGEKPRRRTIALYGDFFTLMHQIEAEQTSKPQELIWGIGISSWLLKTEKATVFFEYPLLTQAMELSIDDHSMAIEIRPRATDTQVELDAFIACQVSGTIEVERSAMAQLTRQKDRPTTPFDPGSYSDVLKLIAGNLDSEGQYKEVLNLNGTAPPAGEHLVVTDAWVLLSRPRTINYLFEDLKRLQEKLEDGCTIHEGPLALVVEPSDEPLKFEPITFRGLSGRGSTTGGGEVEELYFPLPYNDEQVTIVQRLKRAPGVTVQGPPGTGKTHTIANVICHYLASGKRVLVTSRGEAALSVLQDKIPEEVRALTVALLTSDRDGIRQFQGSIEAIQHKVSQINPELTRQEIERLRGSIDRAHAELITIDRRIDEIALQQLSVIEVDGVEMRAQKLAELVVSGRDRHGWFDDEITLSPPHAPPLSSDEASRLREARRSLSKDLVYVTSRVPSPDSFPSVATICDLHDVLVKRGSIEEEVRSGGLTPLKANTPEVFEAARALVVLLEEMIALTCELKDAGESWPFELRKRCGHVSFASERSALESLLEDLDTLVEARAQFLKFPIAFPTEALEDGKTSDAVSRAAETGKPFGFLALGTGDAKEYIAAVRVQGRAPANRDDWQKVKEWIALHEQVLTFETRWNTLQHLLSVPALAGGVTSLRQLELIALSARKAHRLACHFDVQLGKRATEVFGNGFDVGTRTDRADLEEIRRQLGQHLVFASLSSAANQLSDVQEKLAGKTGPVSEALRAFVRDTLGNEKITRERAGAQYAELIEELRRIAALASYLSFLADATNRIEVAGAPKLAARVRSVPVGASGEDITFPTTWKEAWNWARVRTHLDQIEAREELLTLARRRRDVENGLARFYREMVAKTAWLATKQNATPRVLQALAGYATAVRRIGQGTGPNATRYRRDAREMMYDAAGAVPCWIMNHSRISEAMPADVGAFDLVIVDEASQSDLWALPAILRGKRILVVGDDKQVSPDGGFIESTRIQELLDRFLTEQPFKAEMTPEKSLYDLAARVFAADQVMLREHFRCVPPIIAYSNRTFYQNQILPLRIPRASERIEPPLVDIYVEGGLRDAHDRNDCEAQAIADEISAILANENFAHRTIGIVSLLGSEQAKHIDSVVTQRCDAAELRRRRFLCGDARAFQGSERHIMFLSMVADRRNCKALSGSMFDQRFNVAASRAQDRMYLVRSIVASDLSDKDLRASLLSHFDKPMVLNTEDTTKLIDLCESGFERDVYSELTRRGYRVIPQVKTGAYRIDLVVEGAGDVRLAIECDGDEYHGPDKWAHDMNRQRILERAGWVFWRCFASTWALRKDEVIYELCERLNMMGIEPLGALEHTSTMVEKRVWHAPVEESVLADSGAEELQSRLL
ncbi:MAG TPA: AAA domain-containing protein [Terracidiphilus sp.]|jgi:very-short-patch-repair endonuclease